MMMVHITGHIIAPITGTGTRLITDLMTGHGATPVTGLTGGAAGIRAGVWGLHISRAENGADKIIS